MLQNINLRGNARYESIRSQITNVVTEGLKKFELTPNKECNYPTENIIEHDCQWYSVVKPKFDENPFKKYQVSDEVNKTLQLTTPGLIFLSAAVMSTLIFIAKNK